MREISSLSELEEKDIPSDFHEFKRLLNNTKEFKEAKFFGFWEKAGELASVRKSFVDHIKNKFYNRKKDAGSTLDLKGNFSETNQQPLVLEEKQEIVKLLKKPREIFKIALKSLLESSDLNDKDFIKQFKTLLPTLNLYFRQEIGNIGKLHIQFITKILESERSDQNKREQIVGFLRDGQIKSSQATTDSASEEEAGLISGEDKNITITPQDKWKVIEEGAPLDFQNFRTEISSAIEFAEAKYFWNKNGEFHSFKAPLLNYIKKIYSQEADEIELKSTESKEEKRVTTQQQVRDLLNLPAHEIFIKVLKNLCETDSEDFTEENFITQFKALLPTLDSYLRFRKKGWFGDFTDDYYDEFRTPLASILVRQINDIVKAEQTDHVKREQIIRLLKDGPIQSSQAVNSSAVSSEEIDEKTSLNTLEHKNEQKIIEAQEHYKNSWQALSEILKFYSQGVSKNIGLDQWHQIFNGNLLKQDSIDRISDKLPRKMINDFAKLVQALAEIDPNAVILLQICVKNLDKDTDKDTDKIENIFKILQYLFVTGKKIKQDNDQETKSYKINALQDKEFEKVENLEKEYIRYLYNFYEKGKTKEQQCEEEEKNPLEDPTSEFEELCYQILYNEEYELEYKPNTEENREYNKKRYFLYRDLKYYVFDKIAIRRKEANDRLDRLQSIINDLAAYCGLPPQIQASKKVDAPKETKLKRKEFYRKPYEVYAPPKSLESSSAHFFERLIVPADIQTKRHVTERNQGLSQFFSGSLGGGEGFVAGRGNYELLNPFSPTAAAISIAPTILGAAASNYAIVQPATADTLNNFSGIANNDQQPVSGTRKFLTFLLAGVPSLVSGLCYAALGGLSTLEVVIVVLGFIGISLVPGLQFVLWGTFAFLTLVTMFALLHESTKEIIQKTTWKDIKNYFKRRFYWPSHGSSGDKLVAVFSNIFSLFRLLGSAVLVVGLLFLTSLKLFATSLIAMFAKVFWAGAAAEKTAAALSWINSSLWVVFNFKKGSSLFDLVYPRGLVKLITYPFEIAIRTAIFILPALFCLAAKAVTWFFNIESSNRWAQKFENCLEQMAPIWLSSFWNKHLKGRTYSGIDDKPNDKENEKPIQIIGGLYKSTIAIIKLIPYLPEIGIRAVLGIAYKITWPVRVVVRRLHNWVAKKSERYRRFIGAFNGFIGNGFFKKYFGIKENSYEVAFGDILVPRATITIGRWLNQGARWFQEKLHHVSGNKLTSQKSEEVSFTPNTVATQTPTTAQISCIDSDSPEAVSPSVPREPTESNFLLAQGGNRIPDSSEVESHTSSLTEVKEIPSPKQSESPVIKATKAARDEQNNLAGHAVLINSVGQGAIFSAGSVDNLPISFLKHASVGLRTLTTFAPQGICSGAINHGALQNTINSGGYEPFTLIEPSTDLEAAASALTEKSNTDKTKLLENEGLQRNTGILESTGSGLKNQTPSSQDKTPQHPVNGAHSKFDIRDYREIQQHLQQDVIVATKSHVEFKPEENVEASYQTQLQTQTSSDFVKQDQTVEQPVQDQPTNTSSSKPISIPIITHLSPWPDVILSSSSSQTHTPEKFVAQLFIDSSLTPLEEPIKHLPAVIQTTGQVIEPAEAQVETTITEDQHVENSVTEKDAVPLHQSESQEALAASKDVQPNNTVSTEYNALLNITALVTFGIIIAYQYQFYQSATQAAQSGSSKIHEALNKRSLFSNSSCQVEALQEIEFATENQASTFYQPRIPTVC